MKKGILALLAIGVVASIGLAGAVAAFGHGGATTTDIAEITECPGEWVDQEVTVEGWVGATSDHWFVLCGNDGPSITVKCVGNPPSSGTGSAVRVEGTVGIEKPFAHEQAYIFARSWEYQN